MLGKVRLGLFVVKIAFTLIFIIRIIKKFLSALRNFLNG
jgi:hypothetical protein